MSENICVITSLALLFFKGGIFFCRFKPWRNTLDQYDSYFSKFIQALDPNGEVNEAFPHLAAHLYERCETIKTEEVCRLHRVEFIEKTLQMLDDAYAKTLVFKTRNPATYHEWLDTTNAYYNYYGIWFSIEYLGLSSKQREILFGWCPHYWERLLNFYHYRLPFREWNCNEGRRPIQAPAWNEFESLIGVTRRRWQQLLEELNGRQQRRVKNSHELALLLGPGRTQ